MTKAASGGKKNQGDYEKGNSLEQPLKNKTLSSSKSEPSGLLQKLKQQYFLSLLICFIGIFGCYSGYALLQESLLSDKSKKLNVSFVMGVQSLIAVVIASVIIKVGDMGDLMTGFTRGDFLVGLLNFLTMYCSNFALKYVNYPFMVLAKSAKIMPVVITGWLRGIYKLSYMQIGLAVTISAGLVLFNSSKVKSFEEDSPIGVALVLLSLFFDGFTNSQTDKNHQGQKRDFAYHTMLYNNLVGLAGNLSFHIVQRIVWEDQSIEKTMEDQSLIYKVLLIGLSGAVGQIFIFLTISLHDCYKLTIITTTRKCFSVVASAFIFNHAFSPLQWLGASMVLFSTCFEVYFGKKKPAASTDNQDNANDSQKKVE